ncbi:G patch domain-containing protein 1 [Amphibalanus amphitrite]|uniref:G patch domain-containing protein 1 n=1 Tax=Amphibalanus amphitrite TaxID=1232801 RepID=A0A6A4VX91_AMPAM|nr:G patch domain-containing protein 1 [Amphibalanus amphitrite]
MGHMKPNSAEPLDAEDQARRRRRAAASSDDDRLAAFARDLSDSWYSDLPPKLDAGGVSTSNANKKSTFIRLFSHRVKRTTPRGWPANSNERSEGHTPIDFFCFVAYVPLPPLSQHHGVPVLRCRIEKRLVQRTDGCGPRDEPPPHTELRRADVKVELAAACSVPSTASTGSPAICGLPGRPESERPSQPADSPAVKTEPGAVPADAERLRELHQLLAESGDSPAAAAPALKPFASDPEKQARYEKFLKLQAANRKGLPPAAAGRDDRLGATAGGERVPPLGAASLADKFVSAGTSDQEKPPAPGEATAGRKESTDPATQAARRRMFGFLTRQTQEWHPAALLCRRFNVKNPYPHSSIVGTLGLATGASSMSAPVLPTPTSAADAPAAPKPRLRWDDVLSDEEGGGTDTAAGGGGATARTDESPIYGYIARSIRVTSHAARRHSNGHTHGSSHRDPRAAGPQQTEPAPI